uniref:(California timema) hypothetical protein n=1 Tax=Timema californicum TaxID=61474 RepID=A0A7R9J9K7_TIMCA|nr:unnamed protein product [Timema californicum]
MLLKGTSLTLQCDAIGHPKPTITWSRSNRNMPSGEKTVQGSSITFDSIDRHHAGTYDCTATNDAPEIRVDKETVNSGEGYESALLCTVHAEPSATVTWAKDGKPVNLSSHMKSEVDQHTHILKISKTKKEDFGRYTCIANNTVGTKTKVIELTGLPSVAKFLTSSEEGKNQVVQWSIESHSPIIEYILRYRKQNTDEWVIQKPLVENGEGNVFTVRHTLSDLTPGKYEVVLRSQNEFGWSQDSQPHEFTQSSTIWLLLSSPPFVFYPDNFGEAAFPSSLEASNQPASTGEDTRPRLFALMTLLAIAVFLLYSSPMASLVLSDSSQLTSDSQHLVHLTEIRTSISPSSALELNTTSPLANYATEVGDKEMPFFWKPKEDGKKRTKHSPKQMLAAILSVIEENNSVRASAKTFNIDRKTLERYYNDDSDEMTEMDSNYSDPDNDLEDFEDLGLDADYSVGDFVLVKFCGKQSVAHYAGRIDAKNTWTMDSVASSHMTWHREYFDNFEEVTDDSSVCLGDNHTLFIKRKSDVMIQKLLNGQWYDYENKMNARGKRKSSLGSRLSTIQPSRFCSLGNSDDGPKTRGRISDKRTLIPKPTQRAGSFDREKKSSVHRSGSLDRAMGHLLFSSNKGSQKNKNTYATPQQTPSYLLPMSVSSSRGLTPSLLVGHPWMDSVKSTKKDSRALTEKNVQLTLARQIHNYFTQKLNLVEPLSKGFNQRTITIKMFVDMMSQLLHFYFPKCIINSSNYTEEIPRLMKKLMYPYNVNKSWLVTVNAPCSWPQVLGILSWLIDLQEESATNTMDMAFPDDDEDDTEEFISDKWITYFETYNLWRAQQDDDVEVACTQLEQKMMDKVGFSEAEEQKYLEEIQLLQEKLNDPEILKAVKEIEVLSKTHADLQENIKVLSDYIAKSEAFINDFEIFKRNMEEKNQSLVESISSKEKFLEDLKCKCENQIISLEEKNRIDEECASLKQEIENMNAYRDTLNNQLYSDDIKISQLKDKWNKLVVEHNKRILNMNIQFPELQQFTVETKFTQQETMENLDIKLYELEKQLNEDQEVIKNELKVLKERNDLVIQSNKKKANEVKKLEAQHKKSKDTLNNLRAEISKEEAEHQLLSQNLVKKIKRLKDEDFISKEESAQAEYKQEREKLEQISSELKEMDEKAKRFFTKIYGMLELYVQKIKERRKLILDEPVP